MTPIDALVTQLSVSGRAVHRNLEGISNEESICRAQPAGNCANWIVGHIVASRSGLLKALGEGSVLPEDKIALYRRGSDGRVEAGMGLEDLIDAFDRSQPLLLERLGRLSEAELAAKSPIGSPAGPDATFGEALSAIVFHEAYHVGQLGIARRLIGKPGAI
jgi:uncharacterized damage-inducible protein DinB